LSTVYLDDIPKIISNVNSSAGANVPMIPTGVADTIQFIHHGVSTSTHLGGPELLMFAHGNLSESPFKTMDLMAAVGPLYLANLVRTRTIAAGYPAFDSLCEATTEEDFRTLKGEGNHVLKRGGQYIFGRTLRS
jgi:hypothetical protein